MLNFINWRYLFFYANWIRFTVVLFIMFSVRDHKEYLPKLIRAITFELCFKQSRTKYSTCGQAFTNLYLTPEINVFQCMWNDVKLWLLLTSKSIFQLKYISCYTNKNELSFSILDWGKKVKRLLSALSSWYVWLSKCNTLAVDN